MKNIVSIYLLLMSTLVVGQTISGKTTAENGDEIPYANVYLKKTRIGTSSNDTGFYELKNIPEDNYTLIVSSIGYKTVAVKITITGDKKITKNIVLLEDDSLDEIVISGTLRPVSKTNSPVPVEVYSPTFFRKNPTPSIFESLQNVNGVRPQLNCSVCNTGDIHINGLEGPYTFV
ncbi:carboxypeptidase-like regulatory domain-containing protein, partial [uncultured Polaribacter sp.]